MVDSIYRNSESDGNELIMTLQEVVFYNEVVINILCDVIPFIMYPPIILWFFARVSDAHAKNQIFFLGGNFSWKEVVKR